MRITFLNSTDSGGGAANACKRQVEALYRAGADVTFLSQKHKGKKQPYSHYFIRDIIDKAFYLLRHKLNERKLNKYPNRHQNNFSAAYYGAAIQTHPLVEEADIVHLHWINDSFITPSAIRDMAMDGKKIVWTLHDMWALTGGCHYSGECIGFQGRCGHCPALKSDLRVDFSHEQLVQKMELFKNIKFHIITPSHWLAQCARESILFRDSAISVIRYALDTEVYQPLNKAELREKYNIDPDKKLILFGAVNALKDERKGFKYLAEALEILQSKNLPNTSDIELAVFGSSGDDNLELPFKTHFLGNFTTDESIVEAYNLADVFATPSLEDNLPNTVMESMACGVPVVGFKVGGIPEMIDHLQNGFTAEPLSAKSLAAGIHWILEDKERYQKLCDSARAKTVREYAYSDIAEQHIRLYNSL